MMDISVEIDYLGHVYILKKLTSDRFDINFIIGDNTCGVNLTNLSKADLLIIRNSINQGLKAFGLEE